MTWRALSARPSAEAEAARDAAAAEAAAASGRAAAAEQQLERTNNEHVVSLALAEAEAAARLLAVEQAWPAMPTMASTTWSTGARHVIHLKFKPHSLSEVPTCDVASTLHRAVA